MQIFISHSSKDAKVANEICAMLENDNHQCFIAPRDIRSGYEYAEEIVNGIDKSEAILLLLSKHSNESPHVLREIERAVSKSIPVIVYKLEEVQLTKSMEYFLMTHHWIIGKSSNYHEILECVRAMQSKDYIPPKVSVEKQKKNTLRVIGAAGLVIAVIIAGIAVFSGGNSKNTENNKTNIEKNTKESVKETETTEELSENKETETKETVEENTTISQTHTNDVVSDIEVGQELEFGSYNGETITWRVLKLTDDGKQAVLISKNILTMKAYDVAETGKFNYDGETDYYSANSEASTNMELQAKVRGNSDWSNANIRTWLNAETEVVKYEGQKPVASAMAGLKNGYQNEPGFLYGFTEEELEAIVEIENRTNGNALHKGEIITTKDKVYLLSKEELIWFEEGGMSMLAEPTEAAVAQDQSDFYQIYSLDLNVTDYIWWLREPVEDSASKCYVVGNGYVEDNIQQQIVGAENFGIRPAITVDVSKIFR